ncbi:dihydroorotate dehydrogenase electron transfer subunit [Pseudogracilibacillus sp. SE30717A]|uniref:dihydroorotate dehydrogenase electron transfer subunit n=1 Tax=Pseudogracilibacillus sp. SE30717A TaxID=3098293 RepID=UPI00300E2277
MIKKEILKVMSVKEIATDSYEMSLENEYISTHAVPGQFLHLSIPGHTLRRPISIASCNQMDKVVKVLFKTIGTGTKELSGYQSGEQLDGLGPIGHGFPIEDLKPNDSVLLIGGGIGIPPIYFLATALKERGIKLQFILGFQSKDFVFYEKEFNMLGETYIVTNDGSYGHRGLVTDLIPNVSSFDRYYACGPLPMLKAVKKTLAHKKGYISFEERMGCGVGACFACVLKTNDGIGYKKICQDGPVFAADEVII